MANRPFKNAPRLLSCITAEISQVVRENTCRMDALGRKRYREKGGGGGGESCGGAVKTGTAPCTHPLRSGEGFRSCHGSRANKPELLLLPQFTGNREHRCNHRGARCSHRLEEIAGVLERMWYLMLLAMVSNPRRQSPRMFVIGVLGLFHPRQTHAKGSRRRPSHHSSVKPNSLLEADSSIDPSFHIPRTCCYRFGGLCFGPRRDPRADT